MENRIWSTVSQGGVPGLASVITQATSQQAAMAQARLTGGASNYAAQNEQQAQDSVTERRRVVSKLVVAKRPNSAMMAALPQANALHKHYDQHLPERDPWAPWESSRKRRRRYP